MKTNQKKPYVAPKVTTHGDAAKLTLHQTSCAPKLPECHSHLPVIPVCPKPPSKHWRD